MAFETVAAGPLSRSPNGRLRGAVLGSPVMSLALRLIVPTMAIVMLLLGILATAPARAALPDGRDYERVTPADKGDAEIAPPGANGPVVAWPAVDGSGVLYRSSGAFAGVTGNFNQAYVASRTPAGWRTAPVPAAEPAGDLSYRVDTLAPDLSMLGVDISWGKTTEPSEYPYTLAVGRPNGPYSPVATFPSGSSGLILGASDDFSHVVFETTDTTALTPPASGITAGNVVYEWADGRLRLVNVNTDGSPVSSCGAVVGNGVNGSVGQGQIHTVSRDGSRIFFLSPDPDARFSHPDDPACTMPPELYVRENGATTTAVSAPAPGVSDPSGRQPVTFAGASSDGSKVFFMSTEMLTTDATANDPELYEYDLSQHRLTRVSRGASGDVDGNVQWAFVSDDGSAVYLAALSQLVPGTGTAGVPNLYRYDTAARTYRYIATLTDQDIRVVNQGDTGFRMPNPTADWYATPDGLELLFTSEAPLTPDSPSGIVGSSPYLGQLYRYDAVSGGLSCVSCPPAGATPTGVAEFITPFAFLNDHISRYTSPLTDDGGTAFFDTPDALVAKDTNGERDVYEWHAGTVALISSGTDSTGSYLVGAGADGRDVFFSTRSALLPEDRDDLTDIYDARIGGGFPSSPSMASCEGDDCQGTPSQMLLPSVPASSTVFGLGNAVRGAERGHRFYVARISSAQRARFARTGRLRLTIRTSTAGKIRAIASARLDRHARRVASAKRNVARRGTVHVTLRLSRLARRTLASKHRLQISIAVTFSHAENSRKATLTLRRSHR